MRDGAARALAIAFLASILLHAAVFSVLPLWRELSALVPPVPEPLIARVVRPEPPPPPPAPVQESRRPVPPPPKVRAPIAGPAPAPEPVPAPQAPAPAPPQPTLAPEPVPAPAAVPAQIVVAPAPPPAAPAIDPRAVARFEQSLLDEAAEHKRYPRVAIDNNWQGEVMVRMTIGTDGRIARLSVERSSGYGVLDRQALEMFRNAKPRVPIPAELRGKEFDLELRAVYSLRDQRSG
jgi:protein TonB